jgi:excisionase family DNA binding protein
MNNKDRRDITLYRPPAVAELMTIPQVAHELGLSPHTVRSWMAQRRIGYFRLGRSVRIDRSEIQRILNEGHCSPVCRSRTDGAAGRRTNEPEGESLP